MKRIAFIGGEKSGRDLLVDSVRVELENRGYRVIIINQSTRLLNNFGLYPEFNCSKQDFYREALLNSILDCKKVEYFYDIYFSEDKENKYIVLFNMLPECNFAYADNDEELKELKEIYEFNYNGDLTNVVDVDKIIHCDTLTTEKLSDDELKISNSIKEIYKDRINLELDNDDIEDRTNKVLEVIESLQED